jgi:hypothetical protein
VETSTQTSNVHELIVAPMRVRDSAVAACEVQRQLERAELASFPIGGGGSADNFALHECSLRSLTTVQFGPAV